MFRPGVYNCSFFSQWNTSNFAGNYIQNMKRTWHNINSFFISVMDLLLLGSHTRFLCSIIKLEWTLWRAKTTNSHTPSFTPINVKGYCNLNLRQFYSCHNIHVYSTSIVVKSFCICFCQIVSYLNPLERQYNSCMLPKKDLAFLHKWFKAIFYIRIS